MKQIMHIILIVLVISIAVGVLFALAAEKLEGRLWTRLPVCQEDAIILGVGEFIGIDERGGQWEFYVCGPSIDGSWNLSNSMKGN